MRFICNKFCQFPQWIHQNIFSWIHISCNNILSHCSLKHFFWSSSQMENIGWFSDFLREYGVQAEYIFVTVDLYEKQNVPQVSKYSVVFELIKWKHPSKLKIVKVQGVFLPCFVLREISEEATKNSPNRCKTKTTCSPAFSRATGSLLHFIMTFHWF